MSTKLNAEELAAKRYPYEHTTSDTAAAMQAGRESAYAAAIREVAQPIAEERDEYREALVELVADLDSPGEVQDASAFLKYPMDKARHILSKYPKP
jgi:hypothetical protein